MNHFQVLFSGKIATGAEERSVRKRVARELRIDERKVAQLFSGRTVVLRSGLSEQDAYALQARFADLGALCRIKDLTPKAQGQQFDYRVDRAERAGDQTLRDITAAHVECPRCGHMQLDTSHCARCGVDIGAAISAKRKEDLIIEKRIRELKSSQRPAAKNVSRFRSRTKRTEAQAAAQTARKAGKIKSWFRKSS